MTSIIIPAGVTVIGNEAFKGCSALRIITFAESCVLENIGKEAVAPQTETTEGVEEGMKQVVAEFAIDFSGQPGGAALYCLGAFDRYTGTDLEFCDSERFNDTFDPLTTDSEIRTLICPEDYDGAVFYIGYRSAEMYEMEEPSETPEGRSVSLIDDLPGYYDIVRHDRYFCHTASDQ